ncbi:MULTISPECIES: 16S rRNA (uracil(1498)-N(3))-methyltransferase [Clostridium]|uniref:Ribosomal RNA small subunit methyltransferase E n=1 Tax=Clostridium ragsdalei P11 TaxID=1353534 RepID=A0A1A6B0A6_9CLOT|nr:MULTISPECIES: 16S rRNA (uracil(1498)-N(3))-methyltransferase [Clostridium]OBR95771.1 ribosomal RNA small subunit methyltransferase E [Clostridium ragsdalei P11]QXE20100.1 16S rRNA (uracil(1498)-N(3))-methyltransferase [Clostridium sp. 001]
MNKFFVPQEDINFNIAYIRGEDVKHIRKVLRLKCGDKININNCNGKEFLGAIEKIDKDEVVVNIIEELTLYNESNIKIYLFQGLPKSGKMDLIVQKAVELGVYEITPVVTSRVVVKNDSGEFKKVDRWNKIAKEACKQCKRSIIPKVNVPISFKELLSEGECMDLIVVPYENESNAGVKKIVNSIEDKSNLEKIAIVIGPEGGFEEQEIDELKNINSHIVTLGPRILRTETAGFVCISLIMYELGDLGGLY